MLNYQRVATRCPIVGEHSLVRLMVDTSYLSFFWDQWCNWKTPGAPHCMETMANLSIIAYLHTDLADLAAENAGFHGFSINFQRVSCDVANRPAR